MTLKRLHLSLALLIAVGLPGVTHARDSEIKNFSRTVPISVHGSVSVDNDNGAIEIVAWDKSEISIEAEIRGKTPGDLQRIEIEVSADPDRVSIRTRRERTNVLLWSREARGSVTYKIRVPAGISLDRVAAENASITVTGVRGPIDLSSENGQIRASGLTGNGRFHTENGAIAVAYDAFSSVTKVVLKTENGSCTLHLPTDAGVQLNARTENGSVACDFPIKLNKSGNQRIAGTIGDGRAEVSLQTENGGIHVRRRL